MTDDETLVIGATGRTPLAFTGATPPAALGDVANDVAVIALISTLLHFLEIPNPKSGATCWVGGTYHRPAQC
jgi:hypothetical protein